MIKNSLKWLLPMFAGLIAIHSGCLQSQTKRKPLVIDTLVKGNFKAQSGIKFDSVAVDTFLNNRPKFAEFKDDFKKLYALNHYNYVWYDKKGLIEPAISMVDQIKRQSEAGIFKTIPYQTECEDLLDKYTRETNKNVPDLQIELMLTAQYFNYAKNRWGGASTEKTADIGWYMPKKKLSYLNLLEQTIQKRSLSDSLAVVPQYSQLLQALEGFKKHRDSTGKDIVVEPSKRILNVKFGDTLVELAVLKQRLYQLGDFSEKPIGNVYDDDLLTAINSFKNRVGLSEGKAITTTFLKALNVSTKMRIEQVIVNLERMRWLPVGKHADEFILVNIPEFRLHYFENDKDIWGCNVVVGKTLTKTVIFRGEMQYIVFSPYWYLPQSIINKEIKPGMANDPNYLANHRMEWNNGQVRQRPGKDNSLGLVKFIFPNNNNIYLHDTPAKSLFNESSRAFSHGCVRVAKPFDLAERILKQDTTWTATKIRNAMHAGAERTVVLKKKIPVDIAYFTSFVDDKGKLNFREDIYQRDARLLSLLMAD